MGCTHVLFLFLKVHSLSDRGLSRHHVLKPPSQQTKVRGLSLPNSLSKLWFELLFANCSLDCVHVRLPVVCELIRELFASSSRK